MSRPSATRRGKSAVTIVEDRRGSVGCSRRTRCPRRGRRSSRGRSAPSTSTASVSLGPSAQSNPARIGNLSGMSVSSSPTEDHVYRRSGGERRNRSQRSDEKGLRLGCAGAEQVAFLARGKAKVLRDGERAPLASEELVLAAKHDVADAAGAPAPAKRFCRPSADEHVDRALSRGDRLDLRVGLRLQADVHERKGDAEIEAVRHAIADDECVMSVSIGGRAGR